MTDNVIPLADYACGRRVLGAPAPFTPCGDCPTTDGCARIAECVWAGPHDDAPPVPDIELRLVEPPDIIA